VDQWRGRFEGFIRRHWRVLLLAAAILLVLLLVRWAYRRRWVAVAAVIVVLYLVAFLIWATDMRNTRPEHEPAYACEVRPLGDTPEWWTRENPGEVICYRPAPN
jgi:hypothetical protein